MMTLTPPSKNGSTPRAMPETWLQLSVQTFFSSVNWENSSPEVQEIRTAASENAAISLTLSVCQFFATVNWDDAAIAAPAATKQAPIAPPKPNDLTLDDFSSLF